EVDYEKVAADPEPHTRAVLEFLGLPFEPGCLSFHEQSGAVTTASAVQVRKPAHTGSIGRWRRYEQALEPLAAMLREQDIPLD
ncbi:MAG: sulfotransferase family protein, partial [Pseudomonadota bacterium]